MDVGKQFAQYLYHGKIAATSNASPASCTKPRKEEFIALMEAWFDILCECNQFDGLKDCAATAVDIFADWTKDILYATAKLLMRNQLHEEAIKFFKLALTSCVPDRPLAMDCSDFDIQEDLEQAYNKCIPRWHFRMINDISRNRGFCNAIEKAINVGCSSVVDIGAGSGILSIFAAANGAKSILSFEVSKLLCDVASSVISAYGFQSIIQLLNKMSTEHTINVADQKPDLAVMEIFDCGLFGEGVIPTLKHALPQLLRTHSCEMGAWRPRIIPRSARLFATLIECPEIRKHSRSRESICAIDTKSVLFLGKMDPEDASEQPYTTENLDNIKGGYRCLSQPVQVLEISFDSIEALDNLTKKNFFIDIPVAHDGHLDAIAVWFELKLDDEIVLDSSPHAKSCWDQAVYQIQPESSEIAVSGMHITKGSSVELKCCCSDQYLQLYTHQIHPTACNFLEENILHDTSIDFNASLHTKCSIMNNAHQTNFDRNNGEATEKEEASHHSQKFSRLNMPNTAPSTRLTTANYENTGTSITSNRRFCNAGTPHTSTRDRASNVDANETVALSDCNEVALRPVIRSEPRSCSCGTTDANSNLSSRLRTVIPVNRRKVARMNDDVYYQQYSKAIGHATTRLLKNNDHIDILFICEDITLLPLLVKERGRVVIDVSVNNRESLIAIEKVAAENNIGLKNYRFLQQSLPEVTCNGKKYDLIVTEVIEENGMICQCLFNDIVLIRTFLLKRDGILIPESLTLTGQIVQSSIIEKDSFVNDPSVTLGYDIGKFLNEYQVSTQPDINLLNLPHKRLTDDFEVFLIDLTEGSSDEEILQLKLPRTTKLNVNFADDGRLSAVGYWFTIHLFGRIVLSTKAHPQTHWNQSFVLFKERELVAAGSTLSLELLLNRGNMHITAYSVAKNEQSVLP